MGSLNRGSLARLAGSVSQPFHLLAPIKALGRRRCLARCLAQVPFYARCKRSAGLARGLHRRQLRPGEKRGPFVGPTKRGKGTKWMVVVDGQGIPIGSTLASASPAEVKLSEETLDMVSVPRNGRGSPKKRPIRLIGDKAYDSDPLHKRLKELKIDLIVPHLSNRKKPKTQDGRKLKRYRKRWKVERTFSWFSNFRRLVVRYELLITVYSGFFHIACLMIVLNRF